MVARYGLMLIETYALFTNKVLDDHPYLLFFPRAANQEKNSNDS